MKFLIAILVVIAVFLAVISARLFHIEVLLEQTLEQGQLLLEANKAVLQSEQQLSDLIGKQEMRGEQQGGVQ